MRAPIRVMIVDDSAIVRQVASAAISAQPDMEVMATAADPLFAIEKMRRQWPDVIVLDIEMPRMDGLTFLRKLMAERPTPVVICSSLVDRGARASVDALAAGALSLVSKPKVGVKQFLQDESDSLVAAVRAAAGARLRPRLQAAAPRPKLTLDSLPRGPSMGARPLPGPSRGPRHAVLLLLVGRHQLVAFGTPGDIQPDDRPSTLERHPRDRRCCPRRVDC